MPKAVNPGPQKKPMRVRSPGRASGDARATTRERRHFQRNSCKRQARCAPARRWIHSPAPLAAEGPRGPDLAPPPPLPPPPPLCDENLA